MPLRQAAAQIRQALLALAAQQLNAAAAGLVLGADGRTLGYGRLATGRDLAVRRDSDVPAKDPASYQIVGQPVGRRDLGPKVTCAFDHVHDIPLDGMVHGHVIRPPYAGRDSGAFVGRSLLGHDGTAISGAPGFLAIVREGDFLAVVAETAHQAQRLAEALPVRWIMPPEMPPLDDRRHALKAAPSTPRVLDTSGDYAEAVTRIARTSAGPITFMARSAPPVRWRIGPGGAGGL